MLPKNATRLCERKGRALLPKGFIHGGAGRGPDEGSKQPSNPLVAVRNANYYRNAEIGTETTDSSADVTGATVQMNDSFPVQLLPQVGFEPNGTGIYFEQINNSYPNFELSPHLSDTDSKKNGALYESHFQTLLQVMADHPDFLKTLESYESNLSDYYAAVQRFIKANGTKPMASPCWAVHRKSCNFVSWPALRESLWRN